MMILTWLASYMTLEKALKFICLNDNTDPNHNDAQTVKVILRYTFPAQTKRISKPFPS